VLDLLPHFVIFDKANKYNRENTYVVLIFVDKELI
jgi:hypothetical protein